MMASSDSSKGMASLILIYGYGNQSIKCVLQHTALDFAFFMAAPVNSVTIRKRAWRPQPEGCEHLSEVAVSARSWNEGVQSSRLVVQI